MRKFCAYSLGAGLAMVVSTTMAYPAEVSEPVAVRVERLEKRADARTVMDLFEQMEMLRQEVQTLRGMLEVSQHEIEQLNQRQRELYADLDSRISEMRHTTSKQTSAQARPAAYPPSPLPEKAPGADSDRDDYMAAYDLLKSKRYKDAIDAFNRYVQTHPASDYSANAYYWLGEAHVIHDDLNEARIAFEKVLADYPGHQKAPDALLKLGFVYDAAGQYDKAIEALSEVKRQYPHSSVSRLAEQRLVQIKQSMQ